MTEIKRKANAGERIKIVNANFTFGNYTNGAEMVVEKRVNDRSVIVEDYGVPNGIRAIADYEYVVLEPDAPTTLIPDEALGGVSREYREVKRKASVSELVKVTDKINGNQFPLGEVVRMTSDTRAEYLDKHDWWAVADSEYVVLEASDILRIDDADGVNRVYRMVDRKATVGERVIIIKTNDLNGDGYGNGALFTADVDDGSMCIDTTDGVTLFHEEYRVLEPLTSAELVPTPTPLSELPLADQYAENITVLTRKIAQLEDELRVAREDIVLIEEGVSDDIKALEKHVNALEVRILALETDSAVSVVKVAEGHVDNIERAALPTFAKTPKEAVLSPQQVRDEVVERAVADVSNPYKFSGTEIPGDPDGISFWPEGSPSKMHEVTYVVNREKRTVVALIRCIHDGFTVRGIAKCAPGETFNAHIGRAIALYRALGLNVPAEYLTCPQPEEVRVGDVITFEGVSGYGTLYEVLTLDDRGENLRIIADEYAYRVGEGARGGGLNDGVAQIIDDSREDGGVSAASSTLKGAA